MVRTLAGVIGMHIPQCVGNLLGRPTLQQKITCHSATLWVQLRPWSCGNATGFTGGLGGFEGTTLGSAAIACQPAADGVGTVPEQVGDGSLAQTLLDK
ncbi:hypothetical protein ACINB_46140 [Acidovorax sp. NB1]|nr:hypothetical protein ACINB_46140 [Acidovorax sp. NB1]